MSDPQHRLRMEGKPRVTELQVPQNEFISAVVTLFQHSLLERASFFSLTLRAALFFLLYLTSTPTNATTIPPPPSHSTHFQTLRLN
ncbi:UNVERIFIED_CONTAM: hypothetical protein PYX00_001817 [Menopon gallinae]|uniref:Uncharacterized protein n=1 Tax=Menopon gallinae TaxID=328185 RepID=A0AAW2IFI7_9NEOP